MKRLLKLLFLNIFVAACLTGCGRTTPEANIIVASDIHYISPRINDFGEAFQELISERDGRAMMYIEEITDSFIDEVIAEKPDALILTGDLTFNGARKSHEDLAEKLEKVEEAGIPVYVLTGNHDVYSYEAAKFEGDQYEFLYSITTEDFEEIYRDFGYSEALSIDPNSGSYTAKINDTLEILMLDLNQTGYKCDISDESLEWVEEVLREAKKEGIYVLACGHQNLLEQNEMFGFNYIINSTDDLQAVLRKYGVNVYLSGHMHIEHYKTEDGLTEILTSALPLYPNQYATLTFKDDELVYQAQELKVDAEGYEECALESFERMSNPTRASLESTDLSEEEIDELTDYFTKSNMMYFSGNLTGFKSLDPDGSLTALFESSGAGKSTYFEIMNREAGMDYRSLTLKIN